MKRINMVILVVCVLLLVLGVCTKPIFGSISALLAIVVAILETVKSSKLEKKINEYDKNFQTCYDSEQNIERMTIDGGTY